MYVGKALTRLDTAPDFGAYTKVKLNISEESYVEAGDDSGQVLEADCPWATQATANAVLASLNGYRYRPYTGDGAVLEPAADLGDAITTNGFYSGIYRAEKTFSRTSRTNIAAPTDGEINHELQHKSADERRFTRKMREVSAELALKMDTIYAKVIDSTHSFGWELKSDGMDWKANGATVMKLDANGLKIVGELQSGSVITGTLNVGGTNITAAMLQSGASSGYSWANGSYGGYTPWSYSLTGGGYGFNFNSASQYDSSSYGNYFHVQDLWAHRSITFEGYVVERKTATISGTTIQYLGWKR